MEETHKDIKKVFEGKVFFRVIVCIGVVVVLLFTFSVGVVVGFHKAAFGRAWGEHYNENFGIGRMGGPLGGIDKMGMMSYFPNAHGSVGKIIKIEGSSIIVEDQDNTEKSILISTGTKIQRGRDDVLGSDLKIDDFIVVIGTPNPEGIIEAKLIRIVPEPDFLE